MADWFQVQGSRFSVLDSAVWAQGREFTGSESILDFGFSILDLRSVFNGSIEKWILDYRLNSFLNGSIEN
jgi:hypothetical protein